MSGIANQEHAAVLHRLADEGAQRCDALLQARTGHHGLGDFCRQTHLQFVPEALVRPVFDLVGQRHLQVVAGTGGGALAGQGETAFALGVDQLFVARRSVGHQTEPAERVNALVFGTQLSRGSLARYAVEAVAAGHVIAIQAVLFALVLEGHVGGVGGHIVRLHCAGFVVSFQTRGGTCVHQVLGNFDLAVADHDIAAGQLFQVDAGALAVDGNLNAFVHMSFGVHTLGNAGFAHQVGETLLEDTGTDTAQHVIAGNTFQDDVTDTFAGQQLAEQQT